MPDGRANRSVERAAHPNQLTRAPASIPKWHFDIRRFVPTAPYSPFNEQSHAFISPKGRSRERYRATLETSLRD